MNFEHIIGFTGLGFIIIWLCFWARETFRAYKKGKPVDWENALDFKTCSCGEQFRPLSFKSKLCPKCLKAQALAVIQRGNLQ